MKDIVKTIEQQLTNDISKNFNEQLEANLRNALFNLRINFNYQYEFYNFIRSNVIRLTNDNRSFQLKLKSGEYLLTYSHEPQFNMDYLEDGKISAVFGSIEIVNRID